MTSFHYLMITRRIHPLVYWFTVSTLSFGLQEALLLLFHESGLFWVRFILTYAILVGIPVFTVMMSQSFDSVMHYLYSVLELPAENVTGWIKDRENLLFSLETPVSKCIVVLTVIVADAPFIALGSPFHSNPLGVFIFILFQLLFIFGGQAAYIVLASMYVLYQILRYPLKSSFYRPGRISTAPLSNTFSLTAMVILVFYVLHVHGASTAAATPGVYHTLGYSASTTSLRAAMKQLSYYCRTIVAVGCVSEQSGATS